MSGSACYRSILVRRAGAQALTKTQRASIEAVAMDMWDPYVTSVREHVQEGDQTTAEQTKRPLRKIVFYWRKTLLEFVSVVHGVHHLLF